MEKNPKSVKYATSFREQLTVRGIIIGILGAVLLTMSSMYVALKLGALPWPIIFVALVSMFFLKLLGKVRKGTNINEINVTHTIMSAGAMTAGGLAFTLPGIFILNPKATVHVGKVFLVVLGGVILGLIFTALIRKHFIEKEDITFPMGQAAAETLVVGDEGGKKSLVLFTSLIASAIFTALRDFFAKIPATFLSKKMATYGSFAGIWMSPMLVAVGYMVGPVAVGVWFLGALIGDFGILVGGVEFGWWDGATASAIKSSLGIGLMVGTGIGIVFKGFTSRLKSIKESTFEKSNLQRNKPRVITGAFFLVAIAAVFTIACDMGVVPSIITILGVWIATGMSAQTVGQSGINPMEVFGVIVLLIAKLVSTIEPTTGFFITAVVAIACGLAGDVMNDFKAGHILKSDPKAQWIGECIGGIVGAFVAVAVFFIILQAYGPECFGNPEGFQAPQAAMVAAMVGGIPHVPAFIIGLFVGAILYFLNFPVMTLGLGVYLSFYLSATAFIGGAIRFCVQKFAPEFDKKGTGLIIASGVLGGEAVAGVIIALIQAIPAIMAI